MEKEVVLSTLLLQLRLKYLREIERQERAQRATLAADSATVSHRSRPATRLVLSDQTTGTPQRQREAKTPTGAVDEVAAVRCSFGTIRGSISPHAAISSLRM
ncbi:MAG: hypothetical protein KGL39_29880 [Patescibacteria group bacterium]|nr:hypothetical protein [Patescibacteria group bacterium]